MSKLSPLFHRVSLLLLVAILLAVAPLASAAPAETAPASASSQPGTPGRPVRNRTSLAAAEVADYWTPERIAAAVPPPAGERSGEPSQAQGARIPLANGPAEVVKGNLPGAAPNAVQLLEVPGASSQIPTFTYPFPYDRAGVATVYYRTFPWSTNGKLLFTNAAYGVGTFQCSGTSVTSGVGGNENLVLTAAHCLNSGGNGVTTGTWSDNVVFMPAYRNGVAPFDSWTYFTLSVHSAWADDAADAYDYGFVAVENNVNGSLSDKVGAQGLAWNQPFFEQFWSFGYPATGGFNGETMHMNTASTAMLDPNLSGNPSLGIGTDFTGGTSGGGWVIAGRMSNSGYVNAVTSYQYSGQPKAMYGAYLDDSLQDLWEFSRFDVP